MFNYDNVSEIYDIKLNDPINGTPITSDCIENLEFYENLFNLLPSFKLTFSNKGGYFIGYNIKPGDLIYFKITPNINSKSNEPEPYINACYCIQNINCNIGVSNSFYSYTLTGIYNALSYLNEIASFPKTNLNSLINSDTKTSDEAIRDVLDETTLKLISHCDFNDKSLWINSNKTRSQFIDKIVDHAWVSLYDSPLLYTDLNGNTHYTSLKTMTSTTNKIRFENVKYYVDKLNKSNVNETPMLYTDIQYINVAGPILNNGGYTINETLYTPYNFNSLFEDDIEYNDFNIEELLEQLLASDVSITDINSFISTNAKIAGKFRKSEYKQNDLFLANRTNKQSEPINKNINCGIYFKELHNHYDLAPSHNEMIRRSFFQNFINLVTDLHRLPAGFSKKNYRPNLGDKTYIDFSNISTIDKVHSGSYIICGIKHCFKYGNSYTQNIQCVTDGTFGKGVCEHD